MLQEIFFAYWIFLPVGLATLGAFFSGKHRLTKKLAYPADFYKTFRGKRILGSHKTIRGFIAGIIFAVITAYIQLYLYQQFNFIRDLLPFDYSQINPLIFGFLCGFGSLAGDAGKSFFKRQKGIKPGVSWFPFDQIDQIIGGILFTMLYVNLGIYQYFSIIIIWFFIHPVFTFIGYLIKLRRKPL